MKSKLKNHTNIKITIILSAILAFFSDVILVKAQSLPNSSDTVNMQRTITEVDANGLATPIMPMQSSAITYLLMSALFAGVAMFCIYLYRKSASQSKVRKTDNENQKL